jgi:sarcosine oxidase
VGPSQCVVVGAGLAGAAAAWSLTLRGYEVTLVERAQPAANDGSSHGSARIFRYTYTDPLYTRLVVQSRKRWDELERVSGSN